MITQIPVANINKIECQIKTIQNRINSILYLKYRDTDNKLNNKNIWIDRERKRETERNCGKKREEIEKYKRNREDLRTTL